MNGFCYTTHGDERKFICINAICSEDLYKLQFFDVQTTKTKPTKNTKQHKPPLNKSAVMDFATNKDLKKTNEELKKELNESMAKMKEEILEALRQDRSRKLLT